MENKTNKIIGLILILTSVFSVAIFFNVIDKNYLKGSFPTSSDESIIPNPEPFSDSGNFFYCVLVALGSCFSECDREDEGGFIEEVVRTACIQSCYYMFPVNTVTCLF
ncbi:MAG: hypothetical protein AAB361_02270 [Patescibacteria group bacterium]